MIEYIRFHSESWWCLLIQFSLWFRHSKSKECDQLERSMCRSSMSLLFLDRRCPVYRTICVSLVCQATVWMVNFDDSRWNGILNLYEIQSMGFVCLASTDVCNTIQCIPFEQHTFDVCVCAYVFVILSLIMCNTCVWKACERTRTTSGRDTGISNNNNQKQPNKKWTFQLHVSNCALIHIHAHYVHIYVLHTSTNGSNEKTNRLGTHIDWNGLTAVDWNILYGW